MNLITPSGPQLGEVMFAFMGTDNGEVVRAPASAGFQFFKGLVFLEARDSRGPSTNLRRFCFGLPLSNR